jgi:hypothetical protein
MIQLQRFKRYKLILVSGNMGVGKTTFARHAALHAYGCKANYDVRLIDAHEALKSRVCVAFGHEADYRAVADNAIDTELPEFAGVSPREAYAKSVRIDGMPCNRLLLEVAEGLNARNPVVIVDNITHADQIRALDKAGCIRSDAVFIDIASNRLTRPKPFGDVHLFAYPDTLATKYVLNSRDLNSFHNVITSLMNVGYGA